MSAEYQIILPGNRVGSLRLPSDATKEDLIQIEAWLAFNKDFLICEEEHPND